MLPPERGAAPPWSTRSSAQPACPPQISIRLSVPPSAPQALSKSPAAPGPLSARPAPLSSCCRLPRILPGPFLPASSGAPHASVSSGAPLPQGAGALKRLPAFRISPPCPSVLPPPVNPRLSAHASFIMPGLPLQDPAHAPPLPPGLSGRGRTNPPRKGCDALRPGVSAQSPSRSLRTVPGIPPPDANLLPFPSPPISRMLLLMPSAASRRESPEAGPGDSKERTRRSPGTHLFRLR